MSIHMNEVLQKKKEGKKLSKEEIDFFVQGYTCGSIPDYQASALLMAICLKGMDHEETALLTDAMMRSGDTVDLSRFGELTVDKHSTGGVGDKTTLVLAPLAASAGCVVAKMSGRGLGFTGGTVDKMESVPGLRTDLSPEEFLSIAEKVGMCVVGQSSALAPADGKLYALRDVTATIDSIPLIASSIMSKKLASGAKNIVLDVKYGSGAFMKTKENAVLLAKEMVAIGERLDRRVSALVTDMNAPLGTAVGNAVEVAEAISVLKGEGEEQLTELCLSLAGKMISMAREMSFEEGITLARDCLNRGTALKKLEEWIAAQGGDPLVVAYPERLPQASLRRELLSDFDGYLSAINASQIGEACVALGAGRRVKTDSVDPAAGILLHKKVGDRVVRGESLLTLLASDSDRLEEGAAICRKAFTFSPRKVKKHLFEETQIL